MQASTAQWFLRGRLILSIGLQRSAVLKGQDYATTVSQVAATSECKLPKKYRARLKRPTTLDLTSNNKGRHWHSWHGCVARCVGLKRMAALKGGNRTKGLWHHWQLCQRCQLPRRYCTRASCCGLFCWISPLLRSGHNGIHGLMTFYFWIS